MKVLFNLKAKLFKSQFLLLIIVLSTCTDIIQISDDSERDELLVIEGEITDKPGPYIIKLSTTTTIDGLGLNILGQGAEVIIEQEAGGEEILEEIEPGTYHTDISGIQGQIGQSYRLKITLANGDEYQSPFEVMPKPVKIASLNTEFIDETFTSNGLMQRTVGHILSAQLVKEVDVQKFYQFKVDGIQEVEVSVDGTSLPGVPPACPLPTPANTICYALDNPLQNQIKIFTDFNIAKDNYSVDITTITAEHKRRYLAEVEVHSFSSERYNFWSTIEGQLNKNGDIFDSPIPPVIGNVRNVNTNASAQGHFTVASVSFSEICMDRSNVQIPVSTPLACADNNCATIWAPATYTMPVFGFCQ